MSGIGVPHGSLSVLDRRPAPEPRIRRRGGIFFTATANAERVVLVSLALLTADHQV